MFLKYNIIQDLSIVDDDEEEVVATDIFDD